MINSGNYGLCVHVLKQVTDFTIKKDRARPTTLDPTLSMVDLKSTIKLLMHKLMFQAGVKGMSEQSELIPCM